jgi:hypothetical protein
MGISAQQMLGSDPEYLQRQLAQQEIQKYQNFQNPQLGFAATSGAMLGRGIANLFSGRGFFDVADPALRRVSDVNRIITEGLSGIDPTDVNATAAAYGNISKQLAAAGYAQPAILAAQEAAKIVSSQEAGKKISSVYQAKGGGALYEKGGRLFKMDGTPVSSDEVELIVKDPLGNIIGRGGKPGAAVEGDKKKPEKPLSAFGGSAGRQETVIPPANQFANEEKAIEAERKSVRQAEAKARMPKDSTEQLAGQALVNKEYKEIEAGIRKDFSPEAKRFLEGQ